MEYVVGLHYRVNWPDVYSQSWFYVQYTEYQLSVSGQKEEIDFIVIKQHAVLDLP